MNKEIHVSPFFLQQFERWKEFVITIPRARPAIISVAELAMLPAGGVFRGPSCSGQIQLSSFVTLSVYYIACRPPSPPHIYIYH
jgi:hypothetical protein